MAITKSREPGKSEVRRGRGRPQARPDDETRAVIIGAAREEFAVSGYAATSMESVARGAGVSTKTLYRLIPNKAALFEAIITDGLDQFTTRIRLRACDGSNIEASLTEALTLFGELVLDDTVIAMQRMVLSESEQFPEIAETFYSKAIKRSENTLASWLKTQAERGLIKIENAAEAAGMLLGMFAFQPQRAVMFGHAAVPGHREIERRARTTARLFLKGSAV
ncbi:TetR/AcrR family transcriptional regulator [Afipia sp. DC4300-2b1]|uniref:TetR/AcrR family transcriptional regulator n=1 Tax=Afipia sp. DC4300-2b1 TaxID=2804672 RepID=UPI003CE828A7